MEAEAAKYIGAGIACLALAGAGIGIGLIFSSYLQGALRNPSAAQAQFPNLLIRVCFGRGYWPFWSSSCLNTSVCCLVRS